MRHITDSIARLARPDPAVGDGGSSACGPRRLDRSRDAAIFQAAIEVLSEVGFDRLTMDEIAARARAGKSTLYRRWPSKAELVLDAVIAWNERLGETAGSAAHLPDTGSLAGDLDAVLEAPPAETADYVRWLTVVAALVTAGSCDSGLGAALTEPLLAPPRRFLRDLLSAAVARGEISAHCPVELLPDMVTGLCLMRLAAGETPDRAFIRRVFDELVFPLVAARSSAPSGKASR